MSTTLRLSDCTNDTDFVEVESVKNTMSHPFLGLSAIELDSRPDDEVQTFQEATILLDSAAATRLMDFAAEHLYGELAYLVMGQDPDGSRAVEQLPVQRFPTRELAQAQAGSRAFVVAYPVALLPPLPESAQP